MFFIHPSFFILILSLDIIENFLFSCILSHIRCKRKKRKSLKGICSIISRDWVGFFSYVSFIQHGIIEIYKNTNTFLYTWRREKKNYKKSLFPGSFSFHEEWLKDMCNRLQFISF